VPRTPARAGRSRPTRRRIRTRRPSVRCYTHHRPTRISRRRAGRRRCP
jgi:hypothetical protein